MKITTHRCDFCGSKVPARQPMAQLIVPLSEEDAQLRRRIEGAAGRKDTDDLWDMMFRGRPREAPSTTFDMCLDCAKGILLARLARKALEE